MVAIGRKRGVPVYLLKEQTPSPYDEMMACLAKLPEYASVLLTQEEALEEMAESALLIVVDTNRPEQAQSSELLEQAGRVVVIDHHRRAATYLDAPILSFEDPYASSASELVTELMQHI